MNCVDYLFEKSKSLQKDLILGIQENISYQSIYEKALDIACYLNEKVGKGKNIILISQNSSFFITAYLGILKSGNICVPLSTTIEQNNLDFILNKTKCEIGFISEIVLKKLEIQIDFYSESNTFKALTFQRNLESFKNDFDGDQIAEIIYTSGSTATPKGVMITHDNIIANTNSIIQYLNLNEVDIMMVILPFSYCYGLSLLHTHIRAGGQLVLNNNFIFLSTTINSLNKYHCTGFAGVPSHFQILLRKTEIFKKTEFPYLRYVTQAGGKLQNTFITEFIESFPSIQFFVMYGQTEATARLSYLPPDMLKAKLGSIGKGISGVELKVIDSKGKPVLPGKTGEIVARGKNVMLGYFKDPKESAKTIRNGWLCTGDLATVDEEGFIYLTARKKEIIKVGGKRVSPKEIEGVIDMIPGVIDCSIVAVEDEILAEAIKATIIVSDTENNINEESIRSFCAAKLSNHKIPTIIEIKKEISLNATGKKTFGN